VHQPDLSLVKKNKKAFVFIKLKEKYAIPLTKTCHLTCMRFPDNVIIRWKLSG